MSATEPIVTFATDGKPFAVFCGRCEASAWALSSFGGGPRSLDAAKDAARHCCSPRPCSTCGLPIERGGWCHPCRQAADKKKLADDFAKAKKVPLAEYDGTMVTDGEETYFAPDDYESDGCYDPLEVDGAKFFWGTYTRTASVDLEQACSEDWLQEHHEDAFEWVDIGKLREAQTLVDAAISKVKTFYPDESIAVLVPLHPNCADKEGG